MPIVRVDYISVKGMLFRVRQVSKRGECGPDSVEVKRWLVKKLILAKDKRSDKL